MQQHFNDSLSEHYTMVVKQSQSVQVQLREANLTIQAQKEKLAMDYSVEIDLLNTEIAEAKETLSKLQHTLKEAKRMHIELQRIHDQLKRRIQVVVVTSFILQKDFATLTFESKVRCYGPALPSLNPADIVSRPVHSTPRTKEYTPKVSFTITNFETECKNDAMLCSPAFYSHRGGYKMCLVVYCNRCSTSKGSSTILVSVLKGKYDDHLEWPLNCTVEIEIKNVHNLKGADSIRRFYTIKAQNRVYDDICPNLQYVVGYTKTASLSLSFLGIYLNQGSLKIYVNSVAGQ
jgi:hypothetical protein